jgi:hypothetical protein
MQAKGVNEEDPMSKDPGSSRPIEMAADELKLQAWLARAELENPSLKNSEHHEGISVLAMLRDELRLQMALGRLEARDEWEASERRWQRVMHLAGETAHDVKDDLGQLLADIRKGYDKLRA